MKLALLAELQRDRAAKRPVVLATNLETGDARLLHPDRDSKARELLLRDECTIVDHEFFEPFNPPLRLIVVGAVHVAQPLAHMAALAGFEVIVVDPRAAFATAERFPGVQLLGKWPDEAMRELAPDVRTAVVTLTHDPKIDDPALAEALRSAAFYVGCLGSKKTHAQRLERLRGLGFDDSQLARLHGPVGLRIGARTPSEIAVSILAHIVERLRTQ
jgi:xanthine dehydrogenase accessory factor